MGLQNQIATSHLETLIENMTGTAKATPDRDGDYFIPTRGAGFFARVGGDEPPIIRLFSVMADEVPPSPELYEALNGINTQLSFLRAMHVRGQVMIEGELLALTAHPTDFGGVCGRIAHASDHFGPLVTERFGGTSLFERSKTADYSPDRPEVPGYL